jgi:hypothetical protein
VLFQKFDNDATLSQCRYDSFEINKIARLSSECTQRSEAIGVDGQLPFATGYELDGTD